MHYRERKFILDEIKRPDSLSAIIKEKERRSKSTHRSVDVQSFWNRRVQVGLPEYGDNADIDEWWRYKYRHYTIRGKK